MVNVKSAGETYTLSSGKQMSWEEVPKWFKEGEKEEASVKKPCPELRDTMQKCVEEKGFWHVDCVAALEAFDQCQQTQNKVNCV